MLHGEALSNGFERGIQLLLLAEGGDLPGEVMWPCVSVHPSAPFLIAKGAGSLKAEAGGGKAAGSEAGAAELCLCGGARRGQPERESLGAGVQRS